MKKFLFVVLAVSAFLLIFGGIYAQETPQPKVDETEKPSEPPKVDPDKKYKIKFDFSDGMSFTRTQTDTSHTTNILFNSDLTVRRTTESNELTTTEKRNFTVLDTKDQKITKFRFEFPEYAVRLGRGLMGDSTYPKSSTVYKNQWVEVNSTDKDYFKIVKYSPELASLLMDEEKLYKGMSSLQFARSGCPSFQDDIRKSLLSSQYKPNLQYLNSNSSKLIFPDYSPESSVSVGETWKVASMQVQKDDNNVHKYGNKRLTGFIGDFGSTIEIEFKLESIKVENASEFAVISFIYKYSSPKRDYNDHAYEVSYDGMIVHDLTANRIIYFAVTKDHTTIWEHNTFGKYVSKLNASKTFEYKYDDE